MDKHFRKIDYSCQIPERLEIGGVGYGLRGTVKHSGGAKSGHYVACCVEPGKEERWKFFNDTSVAGSSARFATSGREFGGVTMCFYERVREGV